MTYESDTKVCARCKVEKNKNYFGKDKQKKDGFNSYCKDCRAILRGTKKFMGGYLSEEEYFFRRVKKESAGDCWIWTAGAQPSGHAIYIRNNKKTMAYRKSWEMFKGPIPDGMCVCHKCDNPKCVNPEHLFLGTLADNTRDMYNKGRWANQYKRGPYYNGKL